MSNPNLQQIPARNKDLGPKIRSLFIPEEGCKWGCFDYNQQEPRITVHYASLTKQRGADLAVGAYHEEKADFHQIVANLAGIERKKAKTINCDDRHMATRCTAPTISVLAHHDQRLKAR